MAINQVGKKMYANINDLPTIETLRNGDKLIIQSDKDTCLFDYENFRLDIQHTTFETQFSELVSFSQSVQLTLTTLSEEFKTIQNQFSEMQSQFDTVNNTLSAYNVINELMIGKCSTKTAVDDYINKFSVDIRTIIKNFNPIVGNTTSAGYFDFSIYNIKSALGNYNTES